MCTRYVITAAEHAECLAQTARLEAELTEAQTRYSAFRASMDEMNEGDWRHSYKLGRRVQNLQKRIVDLDQFLQTAQVAAATEAA